MKVLKKKKIILLMKFIQYFLSEIVIFTDLNTRLGPKRGVQVIALYEFSYDMSYHFDWRKLSHTMNMNMVSPLYESSGEISGC